ncbi:uncharacterized protein LOC117397481 isoform X1 [Acipenser ruthenus]|uniref:uncharacterized protein LOC117397481 isoform X1 n=1 Tax=Acipenser ruthenus TaxID=7906 RepID=UPI0027411126|nr:uncharacterized protein LOC117397481 isoform X1 [Acipenser ruthenus]
MSDNSNVNNWTDEETRLLISIWSQEQAQRTDVSDLGKKTHMFREIAAKMLENSFQRSENQCRSRIHVLKRKYLQCRANQSTGKDSRQCSYYEELDAVFASSPVTSPLQLPGIPSGLDSGAVQKTETPSDSATDEAKPGPSEFNAQSILLLLLFIRQHWDLYRANHRSLLFQTVHREFQASGYEISCEKLKKKWNNLLVTYKRAKERCKGNGKAKIAWEYYELMDSILTERPSPPPAGQNGTSVQEVSGDTSTRGTAQPSSQEQGTPAHGVSDEIVKPVGTDDTSATVQTASLEGAASLKGAPLVASEKILVFQRMYKEEAAAEFSTQTTLLLIQCVSRHWDLYSANNRSQLFHTVSKELQLHGIQLSSEKLRKKWNNLIVTYKRAKERSEIAGKPRTTWEYFQLMDNLFSKKGIPPPPAAPISTTCLFPTPLKLETAAPTATPLQPALSLPSSSVILLPISTPSSFALPQTRPVISVQTPWPSQSTVLTPAPSLGPTVPAVSRIQQSPPKKRVKKAAVNVAAAFVTQQTEQVREHSKMLESLMEMHESKTKGAEQRKRRCEQREKRRERREIAMLRALNQISSKQDRVIQLLQKLAEKP